MRKVILAFAPLFFMLYSTAQTSILPQQAVWIRELAEKKHIEPKKIDDVFSSSVFDRYLLMLDPEKVYFTSDDIKGLEKYRLSIDDEFNTSRLSFFTASVQLYKQKLEQVISVITAHCSKQFDFSLSEFYDYSSDTARALNEKELNTKWYYILKTDVLGVLANTAGVQFSTKNTINKAEIFTKEPEIRKKVKTRYLTQIQHLLHSEAEFQQEVSAQYLNSFLECLDPHSVFFDNTGRQNFESQLNTEAFLFGFSLADNDKGEVVIVQLLPGGPAWMSGVLNKGDVLQSMKWSGKDAVDLTGMEAAEVNTLLHQSNTEKLELTIRKGNGKAETILLQKRKLENDENIVKSYVLRGDKKIGYITLPSFYTEWEDASGSKCAGDVAREVIKLKKDSIEGLIMDLRFNGGGSLQEAVEMAGIFIDEGAVGQLRTRDPKVVVMKDMNRGVIYNGPLLLLVNGQSASASELLAACLQDYNRAIIAGSRTYGKATGQLILPVHTSNDQYGFVKLTTSKLYRVNGNNIQGYGVEPDILLPDPYEKFTEHEADNPSYLKRDTVAAYKYFKPMKTLPKVPLSTSSRQRLEKDQRFIQLKSFQQLLSKSLSPAKLPLKWELVEKELRNNAKENIDFEKTFQKPSDLYRPFNNSSDEKFFHLNPIAQEVNQQWLQRIARDLYIEETFRVLTDFIQLNQN